MTPTWRLLGVVDDLWELDWWAKLSGQILAAGVMAMPSVRPMPMLSACSTRNMSRLTLWSGQAG